MIDDIEIKKDMQAAGVRTRKRVKCAADNCTGRALPDNIFCENCWAEVQADAKAAQEYAAAQVIEF